MLKCDELRTPTSCLNKAAPDEPVFVLRAKDPAASQTIRLWAAMAEGHHEPGKVDEALQCAARMDKWREEREPKGEPAPSMPFAQPAPSMPFAQPSPSVPVSWDTPRAARASAGY